MTSLYLEMLFDLATSFTLLSCLWSHMSKRSESKLANRYWYFWWMEGYISGSVYFAAEIPSALLQLKLSFVEYLYEFWYISKALAIHLGRYLNKVEYVSFNKANISKPCIVGERDMSVAVQG